MLYTYIIKNRMNKLHDLTSNVDYIRELIEQYKKDVPESIIPLYYVTDDELTSILANYDSSESVDRKFDDYYSKEEVDELLDQKANFDTYTTDLQFNRNDSVLTLSRNDGQQFSTIIDTGQTPVESPLTVDLTNEIDSFPVNESGSTESSFDFSTSAHIYDGAQEQTITSCVTHVEEQGVSVQVSGVGTDEANISVHVDEGYSFSKNINITISVACAKGTRAILFTLIPLTSGKDGQSAVRYFLQPSATQIKINDDESYSDTTLTCDKMKQVGNGTPTITQDLILKMSIDGGAERPYQTITLSLVRPTVKVQYSLYDTDNRLYDRETIVVVKNGKKGDKGDPGQKGDPGENHVVTYSVEFSQPLINEGSTVVDINAYKIIDGAYQVLDSSQCTVLGEQDAQGKIVTTGSGYFQLKVQDGFKASDIYTVVLYINNNEEVARATLGVIKNRDTLFNLKNWSEVNIGDVCYSEDTLTSSTAISDVVIDDVYDSGKYLCIKTYHKAGNEDIYNTEYWQPFNEYKNIATDLILADKAYVKNLLLNYATAIDSNGHETVSIDGESGRLTVIDGQFMGSVAVPFTVITEDNFDEYVKPMPGSSNAYYIDFSNAHCNIQINYWRNPSTLPTYHIVLPQETLDANYGKEIKIINYIPEKLTLKVKNPSWIDTNDVLHENAFYNGYKIEYGYEATFKLVEMATYVKQRGSTVGYQFKSFADNNGNPTDNCWRLTEKNSHISTEDANYNTPIVYLEDSHLLSAANKAWNYGSFIVYKHTETDSGVNVKLYPLYKRYIPTTYVSNDAEFYFFNSVDERGYKLTSQGWSSVLKSDLQNNV